MRITDKTYFQEYTDAVMADVATLYTDYINRQSEINLDFRVKTSAVYSSNIEGNSIDVSSFMNSEIAKESFKPKKEIEEISDLVRAYQFAIAHRLSEDHVLQAHEMLSEVLLIKDKSGVYRTDRMGIYDNSGLVYLAVEPDKVKSEMRNLFKDIHSLLASDLTVPEVFYHASLIHLKFVQIHPFWDGNGRSARLLEKWFMAEKLGMGAWKIESEQFYKTNIEAYYKNINLGMDYYSVDFKKSIPFLKMLFGALK